ncbi:MAG: hypothetical protein ABJB12_22150 [Pseudomonadota bacterium]
MNQIPIQVFLLPVIAIVAVAYMLWSRKRIGQAQDQQFSSYRAGELAQRLGLQLVAGDPNFNLFIRNANVDVQRGPSDGKPVHIEIRMQGAPNGVPLELVYLYRVERESDFTTITWRTWFDCRMSAQAARPFPPFELISRSAPLGPIAQTQPLPPLSTGNASADATYLVASAEPGVAQLLGQAAAGFAPFANSGVHLVGDGQKVSFVMKQDKAPLLANALYYAENMSQQLSELARRLGG